MAAPAITSVSTIGGSASPLGTPVLISGSGFTGATAVTFGGSPAASFFVQNDSGIVAVSPVALTAGAVVVTVVTTSGTGMAAVLVNSPPAASSHPSGVTPFGESLLAASDAADAQTLLGFVPWSGGTPGILPATSGLHLTTEGGNTLDDGSGDVTILGGTLDGVTIGATTPSPAIHAATMETTGTVTLSGTQKPWLNQVGQFTGTLSGAGAMNYFALNDKAQSGNNWFYGHETFINVLSPSVGLRHAVRGQIMVTSAGTNTQAQACYVGVGGRAESDITTFGGTSGSGNGIGSFWGGWFFGAINSGTYLNSVWGTEIDVCVESGSSVDLKVGLGIVQAGADAVQGTTWDAALMIVNQATATAGWKYGIALGKAASPNCWPFNSASTLIGVQDPGAANIGIDFSGVAFTGPAFKTGAASIAMAEMGSAPSAISGVPQLYVDASGNLHYLTSAADTQVVPAVRPETVTAASATAITLTNASTPVQVITGTSTTQVVVLPTTGIKAGQKFTIINQSTGGGGTTTVEASGGTVIGVVQHQEVGEFTAVYDTPTANFHWTASMTYQGLVFNAYPSELIITLNGTAVTYTLPGATDTLVGLTSTQTLTNKIVIPAITSIATAAGTTALVVTSNPTQVFTGTTTQTVLLPTTSVVAGQHWTVLNTSTGTVTVESSAGNTIANGTLAAGAGAVFTALVATPTTAANWFAH